MSAIDDNAAGGDDRHLELARELDRGLDVDAGQHAVAADVGVDDRLDAVVLELACARSTTSWPVIFDQPSVATLPSRASRPTMMWPGKRVAGVVQEAGILDRRGADDRRSVMPSSR